MNPRTNLKIECDSKDKNESPGPEASVPLLQDPRAPAGQRFNARLCALQYGGAASEFALLWELIFPIGADGPCCGRHQPSSSVRAGPGVRK